jgi:N-acetylglucosamine kinase-like BadF-type ATPase
MRIFEEITLLDEEMKIFERDVSDVVALDTSLKNNTKSFDDLDLYIQQATIINQSLKFNWEKVMRSYRSLPWYSFLRKKKLYTDYSKAKELQEKFLVMNLVDGLGKREIIETAKKIIELEGGVTIYHQFLLNEITTEQFVEESKKKVTGLVSLGQIN